MSITQHHTEWLSLIEISGPFLSLPVLNRTFPQGLESVQPAIRQDLRAAYEEWLDNQGGTRADPALHFAWVEWVLSDVLEMDGEVLLRTHARKDRQAAPLPPFEVVVPEQGETLSPDFVVVNPLPEPNLGKGSGNDDNERTPRLLVMVVPPGQGLEQPLKGSHWAASPATRMMMLLHGRGVRLGLVTNGEQWMMVDAPLGGTAGFISWFAELWLDEPLTLQAWITLFKAGRFFGVAQEMTIESLLAASAEDQQEVTDQLGYQVRHAVELLVQALDRADRSSQGTLLASVSNNELYEAAVVVMMRLVFLLTAEERGLLLLGDELYDSYYALSTLQAQLRKVADQQGEEVLSFRYDAWQRLLALFRGVHQGIHHNRVQLPAYGGDLFDPRRYPFLAGQKRGERQNAGNRDGLRISNRTVLHLLEALQFLQVKVGNDRQSRRLSFRALDIEQIGMVYEGLLDHTVVQATTAVLGLSGTREKEPEIALDQLEAKQGTGLLEFLKEETGRSASALQKALKVEPPDLYHADKLRTACDNDEALYQRVLPWHGLIRNDDNDRPVIIPAGRRYVTAGTARRASGAHYTPRSLGEPLVQHTLEPLVYNGPTEGKAPETWTLRTAEQLLSLKICDMAMGSGALLVQACRYLADRLLEAWEKLPPPNLSQAGGGTVSSSSGRSRLPPSFREPFGRGWGGVDLPLDPNERLIFARRLVAQRCLYGVDKNPLAVEMAKLSLWLITMDRGKPFTFVDHALRCGDSLIGVDLEQLKCWNLQGSGNRQFGTISLDLDIQKMIELRREIETMPVMDVQDQESKRYKLTQAQAIAHDLISAANDLVASYYNTLSKNEQTTLRNALLDARQRGSNLDEKWQPLADLGNMKPFHWQLEFPEVFFGKGRSGFDGFVGNPPFIGGKRIREALGDRYRSILYDLYPGSLGGADLCAIFFLCAYKCLDQRGALGLIATNTIAQGDTRLTGLATIESNGGSIFYALNDISWPGQAAVVVNVIHISKRSMQPPYQLDGRSVVYISNQLDDQKVVGEPYALTLNESKSHIGSYINGNGFTLTPEEASRLIDSDSKNEEIIFPYLNGQDLNSSPNQQPSRLVINFFDWPLERNSPISWFGYSEKTQTALKRSGYVSHDYPYPVAADFKECLTIVRQRVKPHRETVDRKIYRELWWQYAEKQKTLYETIGSLKRVLVVAQTSQTLGIVFAPKGWVYMHKIVVFAYEEASVFALLQSAFHESWARKYCSTLKNDLSYTPTTAFQTFPFPSLLDRLNLLGETYHEHRRQIMLGRQEGLTATYNRFHNPSDSANDIAHLRQLHVEMDHAVAAAYGWSDLVLGHGFHETAQGIRYTISEPARRQVLARLLALNHQRHAEEVAAGLHDKKGKGGKGDGEMGRKGEGAQLGLFG